LAFSYPKPAELDKDISCYFCDVESDLSTGTQVVEFEITDLTIPQTSDLIIDNFYHGLCSDVGEPLLYSTTGSTNPG